MRPKLASICFKRRSSANVVVDVANDIECAGIFELRSEAAKQLPLLH